MLLGLVTVLAWSCKKDNNNDPADFALTKDFSHEVALQWNEFYLEIERYTPGYRPPVSGRTAGYIGLAAYEAVVNGMKQDYNSLGSEFPGLSLPAFQSDEEYHWPTCLNAAYASIFTSFFPTAPSAQLSKISALEASFNSQFSAEVSQAVFNRSYNYGKAVAAAVYQWSKTDAIGHEGYLNNNDPSYVPPTGTGLWQPTYPNYAPALLPHWGEARTFAANGSDVVAPPLGYSENPTSDLYKQAEDVLDVVNAIKAGSEDEQKWIADFWSDDCPILTFTPAGRWIAVANQVIESQNVSLDKAVYTYAKLGMGLNDAGVRCWHEKYRFNIERPIDYIHRVMGQNNWNTIMCPDGSGNYFTPPFPAYPSGHATFGAVAAEILSNIYGDQYAMTDECHKGRTEFRGEPRSFTSFNKMAEENAYSRIPIGVHFKMDADAGLQLGYGIGYKVNNLPWEK